MCLLGLVSAACLEAPPGAPSDDRPDASGVVSTPDGGIDAAPFTDVRTCASIRAMSPGANNGLQEIDPDGDGGADPFTVYCDMEIDGGGWMLVARSAGDDDLVDFGWLHDTGLVNDGSAPYALSINRPGLTFTEILVGSRDVQKAWGDNVYRIAVAEDFVTYETFAVDTDPVTVTGPCEPDGGPAMLNLVGHTDAVGHYYLRDTAADLNFGLFPTGFALSDVACDVSGGLDGQHGMIFVR